MELAERIASLVSDRVLVVGSLPPGGRDLDLLVRSPEAGAIAAGLAADGFENRGRTWARFRDCRAEVVELASAEAWPLPPAEIEALFAEGLPIERAGMVCRPAVHHALLLLARRSVREGPQLREERRERIAVELADEVAGFDKAAARAPHWGATRALVALERAYRDRRPMSVTTRRRAITEELSHSRGLLGARVGGWRAVLRRPRRGALIAVSAVDGDVASHHVEHLAAALELLGAETAITWASARIDEGSRGRQSGVRRGFELPAVAAARCAFGISRSAWPQLLRGRVVLCDGHTLDLAVTVHERSGRGPSRAQLAVLGAVLPHARAAYLVDSGLAAGDPRAALYRTLAAELGVRAVQAGRDTPEVCAELASAAWAAVDRTGALSASQSPEPVRRALRR